MLETVDVGTQDLDLYDRCAGAEAVAQLRKLAAPLQSARIVHVNATPYGGGVAEILRSEIPLLRNLFDMVLLNGMSRYHLAMDALKCIDPGCRAKDSAPTLISKLEASISRAMASSREHLQDPPEIR